MLHFLIIFTRLIGENELKKRDGKVTIALKGEWKSFKTSFSNQTVLKYSLWFIFGMAGYVQVSFK